MSYSSNPPCRSVAKIYPPLEDPAIGTPPCLGVLSRRFIPRIDAGSYNEDGLVPAACLAVAVAKAEAEIEDGSYGGWEIVGFISNMVTKCQSPLLCRALRITY